MVRVSVSNVVKCLQHRDYDQNGLGSKPLHVICCVL